MLNEPRVLKVYKSRCFCCLFEFEAPLAIEPGGMLSTVLVKYRNFRSAHCMSSNGRGNVYDDKIHAKGENT